MQECPLGQDHHRHGGERVAPLSLPLILLQEPIYYDANAKDAIETDMSHSSARRPPAPLPMQGF